MSRSYYEIAQQTHRWDIPTDEAREIQQRLGKKIIIQDEMDEPSYIAGADVSFDVSNDLAQAAIVVLRYSDLTVADQAVSQMEIPYPYIPGYLSFREVPPLLKSLDKLNIKPDVILCDSQGYAHPRRFGLACHLGVLTDIPTLGVAKSKLIGEYSDLPAEKGSTAALYDDGEKIGLAVRTRTNVKPVFVSVGHKINLNTAKRLVLGAVTKYKLPETTREADRLAAK